jgi:hypothetical protein
LSWHLKPTHFYRCTIESILSGCITAWYGNCTAHNRRALQRVVQCAQCITWGKLPANYLPSRTPTAPNVTGRPKISSRTTTTRATACSPRYHPECEVSTGASKLGPRGWKTASISRPSDCQTAITSTERLLPIYTDLKSLATLINGTQVTNNVTLIMFTWLSLLISYVYTAFYTLLLYLSLCRSNIARPYLHMFLIPFLT